jgi:hypothetical protein
MENAIDTNRSFLYVVGDYETNDVIENFCGNVIFGDDIDDHVKTHANCLIFLCGDLSHVSISKGTNDIYVIEDMATNQIKDVMNVDSTRVPTKINNVGVYIKRLFSGDQYDSILAAHNFQNLSESNKPSNAYRKGVYITDVINDDGDVRFNLLRCSTNLDGPTEGFCAIDRDVIAAINHIANFCFTDAIVFNHVLAQVYLNSAENNKKAKIKEHSDKTKDMPRNGLIAFCTFYDRAVDNENALTRLRFRCKTTGAKFDVVLHPGSVFIMSLCTNRMWTHEIVPSVLPIHRIPTRLGYVVRCSSQPAVHRDGITYIDDVPLKQPTEADIESLKTTYLKENTTCEWIDYDDVDFSLNNGDYMKPLINH